MIKTKKVAAICKTHKRIASQVIGDETPTQWIGDGFGMYILAGVEPLNEYGLASVFDYSESDVKSIVFGSGGFPDNIFNDDFSGEVKIEKSPERIIIKGAEYLIFRTDDNLIFIDELYLKPVVTNSQTNFSLRNIGDLGTALCIKKGLLLEAVIMGTYLTNELLKEWFSDIAKTISDIQKHYMQPQDSNEFKQLTL